MELKLRRHGETYIIDIHGKLDLYESNHLKDLFSKMIEKDVKEFIINLEFTTDIDSSGIGTLISIYSLSQQNNLKFCIINIMGDNQKIMELTRLGAFFPIAADLDDAVAQFTAWPAASDDSQPER